MYGYNGGCNMFKIPLLYKKLNLNSSIFHTGFLYGFLTLYVVSLLLNGFSKSINITKLVFFGLLLDFIFYMFVVYKNSINIKIRRYKK